MMPCCRRRLLLVLHARFEHRAVRQAGDRAPGVARGAGRPHAAAAFGLVRTARDRDPRRRKPALVCCPSSSIHNGYGNLAIGMHPELAALGSMSVSVPITLRPARWIWCRRSLLRLRLQGDPHESASDAAGAGGGDGYHQRCPRSGARHKIGSIEWARQRISSCSMRPRANGCRSITRFRISSTARPATR